MKWEERREEEELRITVNPVFIERDTNNGRPATPSVPDQVPHPGR